jgi:fructokinase
MFKIGIDLGGTKIEGIVLSQSGQEVIRRRIETQQERGYEHVLSAIVALYHTLADKISYAPHSFGICTPGSISNKTGLLKNSNTLCLNDQPIRKDLERMLNRSIAIENDANCFAMAEALLGAGKNFKTVFAVIMGTGCGAGIIYNGEVLNGLHGIAGEWGHASIDPNGPACYCGRNGCIETYISGGGLEKMYVNQTGKSKKLYEIVDLFRKGSVTEVDFMFEFFEHFGTALANVINILDPDVVVLGGGLSNIKELYSIGADNLKQHVFNDEFNTPILKNELGDSSGVIGAALIGV